MLPNGQLRVTTRHDTPLRYAARWKVPGRCLSTTRIEKGLMTDPGLNHRLRQRSRRAGIMIGISMLLTIAVCVGSFSVIYAGLDDIVGDFISRTEPDPTHPSAPTEVAQAAPTEAPAPKPTEPPAPTAAPSDNQAAPTPTASADDGDFQPDYQIDSLGSVNLRSGPGTRFDIIIAVPLEQPLQYLGESEPTTDPDNDELGEGQVWMKFRTEDGDEGWIREIDVTEYVP